MRRSTSDMSRISLTLVCVVALLVLVLMGCGPSTGEEPADTATVPPVQSTVETPVSTGTPSTDPTATPVPHAAVETPRRLPTPTPLYPTYTRLDDLVTALQTNINEGDFNHLQATMRDPFVFALYPAETRRERPRAVLDEIRSRYVPETPGIAVTEVDRTATLPAGLTGADLLDGEQPLAAVVYSSGWGLYGTGEGLLLVTEADGVYEWAGLVLANGGFESVAELETVEPPAGLVYRLEDALWRVGRDGGRHLLIEHAQADRLSLNPSATLALHAESEARTVTLFRLPSGEREIIELDATLMIRSYRVRWLNDSTAVVAVTSDGRVLQATTGHLALLDVDSGQLTVLEPEVSSYTRFSVGPDGRIVYDVRRAWHDGEIVPPVPDGSTTLDTAIERYGALSNPVLSPDGTKLAGATGGDFALHSHGYVVIDLQAGSSTVVHTVDPPDTDAVIPWGITWSPGSRWLALDPPSWDPVEDGVWVVSPNGATKRYLGIRTHTPVWIDADHLVFAATVDGETRLQLYDAATGERVTLDVPVGARPVHYIPAHVRADTVPATPLATAPFVSFASWSPEGRWIAYWISSQEDLDNQEPYTMPGGTLHFANVATGESCAVPQIVRPTNRTGEVRWSAEVEAIVVVGERTFAGRPCQTEPYTELAAYVPDEDRSRDPALSPDGRYRAATDRLATEDGILTFETTLVTRDGDQPLQRVQWQIDQRLGSYGLGGEWVSRTQFLIYETLTQGPLLVDVERGVTSVATELFGLEEIPSILGDEDYGLRAWPAPGLEPDSFHLLLSGGVGSMANFPPARLYHAERDVEEQLPYRRLWRGGFSPDHQWLLLEERCDVGGHETQTVWIRRLEDVGGAWQQLGRDVKYSMIWSDDATEIAYTQNETTTVWQTFPGGEVIGRWETGRFSVNPRAWSPDGRFLVAVGNVPGESEYGLFVLKRPSR